MKIGMYGILMHYGYKCIHVSRGMYEITVTAIFKLSFQGCYECSLFKAIEFSFRSKLQIVCVYII